MSAWKLALIDALCDGGTAAGLGEHVDRAAHELGFDHFTYGLWLPLPLANPCVEWIASTPLGWRLRYERMGYAQRDPLVRHALRSLDSLVWSDEIFAACPELRADARAWGLRMGWTQACVNAAGRRGVLTLSRTGPMPHTELERIAEDLRWIAAMAHLLLWPVAQRRVHGPVELTQREVEVLRWTGDGKTSAEISRILAISDNTVNYHLKNAMGKLHATNKTAAVVLALANGLLRA